MSSSKNKNQNPDFEAKTPKTPESLLKTRWMRKIEHYLQRIKDPIPEVEAKNFLRINLEELKNDLQENKMPASNAHLSFLIIDYSTSAADLSINSGGVYGRPTYRPDLNAYDRFFGHAS